MCLEDHCNTLTGKRLEKGLCSDLNRTLMAKAAAFSYPWHPVHTIIVCEYD
jgi:hypothetical protein